MYSYQLTIKLKGIYETKIVLNIKSLLRASKDS